MSKEMNFAIIRGYVGMAIGYDFVPMIYSLVQHPTTPYHLSYNSQPTRCLNRPT